jgi:hypothetical protein
MQTFCEMSDGELTERWCTGRLSEIAVAVARRELARRNLTLPEFVPANERSEEESSESGVTLETVARSFDSLEVEMLRARLQAEGITAFAVDQGINQINALYSIAVGGIRLMVASENAPQARQIIGLVRSGALALGEGEELS